MKTNPNIIQRLFLETPPFWIAVQVIALAVLALFGELAKHQVISNEIYHYATGACTGVAIFAQCAIKDAPIISAALSSPGTLLAHLPELADQAAQINKAFTDPPPAPSMTAIIGSLAATDPETNSHITAALNAIMGDKYPETPVDKPQLF